MKDLDGMYKALANGQFCAQRLQSSGSPLLENAADRYVQLHMDVMRLYDLMHMDETEKLPSSD